MAPDGRALEGAEEQSHVAPRAGAPANGRGWMRAALVLALTSWVALHPPLREQATAWAAVGLSAAVGAAVVTMRPAPPRWAPWASVGAMAALLGVAGRSTGQVLPLALAVVAVALLRLPPRPALATGGAALVLGLVAGLRLRMVTGHVGPMLSVLLSYALTFTAVVVLREQRRHQGERERLLADLAREHRELEEAYARMRAYALHAADLAASEERNRIAREVHDVLAHALTVMIVQAEAAQVRLRTDPAAAAASVRGIADLARSALQEARLSVAALREDLGSSGVAALRRLCGDAARVGDVRCTMRLEGSERPLPAPVALAAYRIVQEGITNARRHGQAREIEVVLAFGDGRLSLTVTDDGRGSDHEEPLPGSGLRGMRERAEALGGTLEAGGTSQGRGFRLRAELPLPVDALAAGEGDRP